MAFGFGLDQLGLSSGTAPAATPAPTPVSDTSSNNDSSSGGDGAQADRGHHETINQASVGAEASLLQGGYNPAVANAVSASRGVGATTQDVERAAADFALQADQAVREGRPLDAVRYADPNLSAAAQEAIYAEAAQQNGTTAQAIEQQAEQQRQAEMSQLQQGLLGGAVAGAGLTGAIDNMLGQAQPAQQPQQQAANPFGIPSDVLAMLRGSMVDMGSTTAALANEQFTPAATPGMEQRQRGGQGIG